MTCSKCGSDAGWTGPKYAKFYGHYTGFSEWLEFTCNQCGYVRPEPTHDVPKESRVEVVHDPIKPWWKRLFGGVA